MKSVGTTSSSTLGSGWTGTTASCRKRDRSRAPASPTTSGRRERSCAAYARTFETPFNENLILSSATGTGGLAQNVFGSNSVAINPGFRNQFNAGFQQAIGKFLLVDADYFWKYTHNAYDFATLLNTTLAFPIAWHNSKLDGITGRLSTTNLHGFQAYWTFGHTRARYFFPEVGGLILQGSPLNGSVFRIDHDQAFQSTVNLRYQRPKNAEWVSLIYRFDSGLVVSGVPDAGAALGLTPKPYVSSPFCSYFSRFRRVLSIFDNSARLLRTVENT